jgi:hypothetical protein
VQVKNEIGPTHFYVSPNDHTENFSIAILLLHSLHEHLLGSVSSGFSAAGSGFSSLGCSFSSAGAGGALLNKLCASVGRSGVGYSSLGTASATGNHGESQCNDKQSGQNSFHDSFLLKVNKKPTKKPTNNYPDLPSSKGSDFLTSLSWR